jgi:endonuclease G
VVQGRLVILSEAKDLARFLAALGMTILSAAAWAADETWGGLPQGAAPVQVLQNPGFLVGYSDAHRQPLWVAYRAESLKGRRLGKRPDRFEPDPRVARAVAEGDYRRSGYQRGHLAPNYLIGKLYGRAAQHATFLMTNVSPQRARLNELVWQRLEEAEADTIAPHAVQLWVVAGPLFAAAAPRLKSGVAVPEAFYRIWLDVERGQPRALAFAVPQKVCGTEPLSRYLTSIDAIEQRTGLDFFAELADDREALLESGQAADGWRLDRFDRRPPRYADKFEALQCES